ncbi:MAG: ribbon-helix-helix domain-containing protein [Solirubrobacteraceae bacterium]
MTIQIAVKLPDKLVHEVDSLVDGGAFSSRSQAVRSGLEAIVSDERRRGIDRCYGDALSQFPETNAELADATRLGIDAIDDEPWCLGSLGSRRDDQLVLERCRDEEAIRRVC